MEKDIVCGKHLCQEAIIDDSKFLNVGMARVEFDNVNLSDASFNNINMSRVSFHGINFDGAKFTAVGFTNVTIDDCELAGLKIRGILVTDMMDAYNKMHGQPATGGAGKPAPQL
jgi:uncharacterized protein YjbI with pentapeptide repeats